MKRFLVALTSDERQRLQSLLRAGVMPARKLLHARILLKADRGPGGPGLADPAVALAVEASKNTVARVRQRYAEEGMEAALNRRPSTRVYQRKLDGTAEAHLTTLACGAPPEGRVRWTLELLAERLVTLQVVEQVSPQTIMRTLKKTASNRG
jgi:transposase